MPLTTPPFGSYALHGWELRLLHLSQHQSQSWINRRIALLLRRLVLRGRREPIDAEVEGLRMRIHVNDNVSERKFLFMPRFCDSAERGYVETHLTPDGVFLDIGANAGIYTLTAARNYHRMGGQGYVLAVEANPTMQARLAFNIGINGFDACVHLAPFALSDHSGEVEFTVADGNLGESGLNTPGGRKLQVPCKTLLDLLRDEGVAKVDGMKIDVEGMEDVILTPFFQQADPTLFPRFIVIEDSAYRWGTNLLSVLVQAGYRKHASYKMNLIMVHDVA